MTGQVSGTDPTNVAADGIRARYLPPGEFYNVYQYDPMGNFLQRADAAQYGVSGEAYAVIDTAQYDAYGNMLADIDANTGDPATSREESIGFGGQNGYFTDSDTAAGLVCLGHRYYDPSTGRFINRDPIGYAGGENLYAFCGGNPVNEVDPEGNAPFSLPTDPSQLKALGWTRNAQRGGPNLGDKHQEWYAPDESWGLDFDRGTPGKPGFRGIDHYHVIRPVDGKTNKWVTVEDVPGSDRGHLEPGGDYDPATGKYLCPEKAEMAAMAEDVAYKARAKADEDARIRAENKRIEDDDYNYEHGGLPDGDPAYDNGSEGAGAGDNLPTENPTTEQNDGTPDE